MSSEDNELERVEPLIYATFVVLLLAEAILIMSSYVIVNTVCSKKVHKNPVWMSRLIVILSFTLTVSLDFVDVNPNLAKGVCEVTNFLSLFSLWFARFFVSAFYILRYEAIQTELKAPTRFKTLYWIINSVLLCLGFISSVMSRRVVNGKCTSNSTTFSRIVIVIYLLLNSLLQLSLLYMFLSPISKHLKNLRDQSSKSGSTKSAGTEDMESVILKSRFSCFLIVASSFFVQIVIILCRALTDDRVTLVLLGKIMVAVDCTLVSVALLFTVGGSLVWQPACSADHEILGRKGSVTGSSRRTNNRKSSASTVAVSPTADAANGVDSLGTLAIATEQQEVGAKV